MDEKTRWRKRLWRMLLLPLNSVLSNVSFSRYYYLDLTTSNSLNTLEKKNENRHTKTWTNFHCLRPSWAVVVAAASTASSFVWSSHPSRQHKRSPCSCAPELPHCSHFLSVLLVATTYITKLWYSRLGSDSQNHSFIYSNWFLHSSWGDDEWCLWLTPSVFFPCIFSLKKCMLF